MKSKIQENLKSNFKSLSKKSIVILGLAVVALGAQSFTTNVQPLERSELVVFVNSPLCSAVVKGDLDAVKKFIEYGVDVNETSNGVTPLMYAARYNKVEIIKVLLSKGADKTIKDDKGLTALKYAELSKATDAVALLKK